MLRRGVSQIVLRVSGGAGLCVPKCCLPAPARPLGPCHAVPAQPLDICMPGTRAGCPGWAGPARQGGGRSRRRRSSLGSSKQELQPTQAAARS